MVRGAKALYFFKNYENINTKLRYKVMIEYIILAITGLILGLLVTVVLYTFFLQKHIMSGIIEQINPFINDYIAKTLQNLRENPDTQKEIMADIKPMLDQLVNYYMKNLNPMKAVKTDDMIKYGIFQFLQSKIPQPRPQEPEKQKEPNIMDNYLQ